MTADLGSRPYVFISYSSADRERALALADWFESIHVGAWIDRSGIAGGTNWDAEIVRGIRGCRALVLLCTQTAADSVNVQRELRLALEMSRPIVPLLLQPTTFPDEVRYVLAGVQIIDVLDRPEAAWGDQVRGALARHGLAFDSAASALSQGTVNVASTRTTVGMVPRHNLPRPPTAFVGRVNEIAQARSLLRDDRARLVTLSGPGGTGKTRLAIEAASGLLYDFEDGVYLVGLEALQESRFVVPAIAQVLGVIEQGDTPVFDQLKEYIGEQHLLLILDNFEQVIEAASTIAQLLAACARLKVLVTSRIPLHVRGEFEVAVPPLDLPPLQPLPSVAELLNYSGIHLFVERAREVDLQFALSTENALTVATICQRLDGLPLALELAAARLRLFPPAAMLAQLERRLSLLVDGFEDMPARQRTLRSTIAWSYDLLTAAEQQLFRRLAVFAGGGTLAAAEAVCDPAHDGVIPVAHGLQALSDASLLRLPDGLEAGAEERSRFAMLATIREFGLDQLDASAEAPAANSVHRDWYLGFAEQAEPQLQGAEQGAWLQRLDADHDNLRAAIRWSVTDEASAAPALRLTAALWRFWQQRGYFSEGSDWFDRALERGDGVEPVLLANGLNRAGALARYEREYARAAELLERSVGLYRQVGDDRGLAAVLVNLANVQAEQGAYERAEALYTESLEICRRAGIKLGIATALMNLGSLARGRCDYPRAVECLEEAEALAKADGDETREAQAVSNLAAVMLDTDDLESAGKLLSRALELHRKLSNKTRLAEVLAWLARVAREQRDFAQADAYLAESLGIVNELSDPKMLALCLREYAAIAAMNGQLDLATRVFAADATVRGRIQAEVMAADWVPYESFLADARAQLSADSFALNWSIGEAASVESLIASVAALTRQTRAADAGR